MKFLNAFLSIISVMVLLAVSANCVSAGTITIGQDLTNRSVVDGGVGNLFVAEVFGFTAGTVTDWSIRSTAGAYGGTRNITPVIVEQTGTGGLGAFTITGIGTTQALSHSPNVQTFNFGLTSGSEQMGPRHYLGWIDSDGGTGRNAGVISYSGGDHFTPYSAGPGSISVGNTLSVTSNLNRRYSLQATIDVGSNEAVGNGASQRAHPDGAVGAVFLLDDPFTNNLTVTEWAFWSWTGGDRWITPLLFGQVGSNFELRGVGASRLVPATQGTITYDFGLESGSDVVGDDYFFGWVDASIDANGDPTKNQGLIRYADDEFFSTKARYFGSGHSLFTPGTNFGSGSLLDRAYSVQALAQAVVPEPSTFLFAAIGLLSLGFVGWRRRKR